MDTKLIIAIVQEEDADSLMNALRDEGFTSTKIGSTGGFLRRGNVTLMIGIGETQVSPVLNIISQNCHMRTHLVDPYLFMESEGYVPRLIEVQVGGAIVFVLTVDRMVRV